MNNAIRTTSNKQQHRHSHPTHIDIHSPEEVRDKFVIRAAKQKGYGGTFALDSDWSQLRIATRGWRDQRATSVSFLVDRLIRADRWSLTEGSRRVAWFPGDLTLSTMPGNCILRATPDSRCS